MATSNFIDTATIWLHAGKGGDGAVTFHRENSWRLAARTAATAVAAVTSFLSPTTTSPP